MLPAVDRYLPGAVVLAAALALLVAGARRSAVVGLGDREVDPRLRVTDDRVAGRARSRDLDLALSGTGREPRRRALNVARGVRLARRVVLLVRVARLELRRHVARIRLGVRVLALRSEEHTSELQSR